MHRTVAFIFKLIAFTMVALLVADTSFMLWDAFTANSRIQAQAALMQQEIAKNNYLSDVATDAFMGYVYYDSDGRVTEGTGFEYITALSQVYTDITFNVSEVNEVKDYGDYHTLKIRAVISPWHYYMSGRVSEDSIYKVSHTSTINYEYTVPCLRYLK